MKNFISATETAKRLSVDRTTLARWRDARTGPPAYRFGKYWKYDEAELNDFIESCRRTGKEFSSQ